MKWFTFEAAGEYLAIEARHIYRVIDEVKPTPVPLVPSCHMGMIYYRGELFDVIEVGVLLGQRRTASKRNLLIILLRWGHKRLALVPDKITGLVWIEDTREQQAVYTQGEYTFRLLTPDDIWKALSELPYGSYKV